MPTMRAFHEIFVDHLDASRFECLLAFRAAIQLMNGR